MSEGAARGAAGPRRSSLEALGAERLAVFFLLLFPAVSGLRGRIQDYDLWWHLAGGRWIVEHGAVPWTDPFSYTAADRPWIAYSWLAEVLYYGLVRAFGLASLLWLQALVAVGVVGFVYLACRGAGARRIVAVATSAAAALGTSFAWGIRPVLFTLLFLAVLVWALQREANDRRLPWLAPLVVALWANLHVLFVGGVLLVGFAALCRTIEGRPSRRLWCAAAFSALAALATPYGLHLPGEVWTMARQPAIAPEVGEFQSPDFRGEFALPFSAFLFPSLVVLSLSRERLTPFELGTYLGTLALGLFAQRNMALFAVAGAPVVARRLEALWPAGERRAAPRRRLPLLLLNGALLVWGLAYLALQAPRSSRWSEVIEPGRFPVAAADFLAARYPGARLFNDFNWGGYLIHRLHPAGARVSIDGRTQVYEHVLRPYMRTWFLEPGWERWLADCDPDVVVWPVEAPLSGLLRASPRWRVVFEDDLAVVLGRVRDAERP